jgi:glycosyltransferase involved in cell wall biosynthesis
MKNGISVIVCCYNSVSRLEETLGHLVHQKFNKGQFQFEIIVVDNASKDHTFEFSNTFLSNYEIDFKVVKELNPGLSNARKKGYETAEYDYLLFCDDDNWLNENYIQTVFEILTENQQIGILGGLGEAVFEGIEPNWFQKLQNNFAVGKLVDTDKTLYPLNEVYGAGFTVRREILKQIYSIHVNNVLSDRKGNNLISGGDTEWCYLAKYMRYEIWCSHDLTFKHLMPNGRMNWEYLKKLYVGFGRTNIYTHAYKYVEVHGKGPSNTLRLPLWLDTYIHKLKELRKFYPKVKGKFNEEGNEEVLRYFGMKGELSELWSLKKKYDTIFVTIESNIKNLKEIRSK